jgi:hypothetical protein
MKADRQQLPDEWQDYETTTLSAYLNEHQRVFSVLGVFIAVTVFSFNLPMKGFAFQISSIFMGLSLLILADLIINCRPTNDKPASMTLLLFLNSLILSGVLLLLYWIVYFRDVNKSWQLWIAWFSFMLIFLLLNRKINLVYVLGWNTRQPKFGGIPAFFIRIGAITVSFLLSYLLQDYFANIVNIAANYFQK